MCQLQENELLELETKTMLLLAPIIEGRTSTKLATLAQECRDYLDKHCPFLNSFSDIMRDCNSLVLTCASEVDYLSHKRMSYLNVECQFPT